MADGVGRGRDLVNSLSAEEATAAEAQKGLLSAVEAAEARLEAAMKCDQLGLVCGGGWLGNSGGFTSVTDVEACAYVVCGVCVGARELTYHV